MAIMVHKDIRKDYVNALNETCNDIKKQAKRIFDDINFNPVKGIKIIIKIEPGNIVEYEVKKTYLTGKVE